jgi:hypothetical protein
MLVLSAKLSSQNIVVTNLQCEHKINVQGIDNAAPTFGWQLQSEQRGYKANCLP